MDKTTHDIIIIGAGPAGLTAGIYAAREMYKTLLLDKGVCGGLPTGTDWVENYPGFPEGLKGQELMNNFKKQAERFGTEIQEFAEVTGIASEGKIIKVSTNKQEYSASAVIVASGSLPKKLDIPGEKEFSSKGVSYCATCDGPLYRGKDVAVVGCGNSGLQEGEFLLKYVNSVTFIEFLPYMTAAKILQERLKKEKKAEFLLNHQLVAISGKEFVDSLKVKERKTGQEKTINVSGVFMYVGFLPNSKFLEGIVQLDDEGYIRTNEAMQTSRPGIYAAGDVRSKEVRQIDTACADATIAVISAKEYLQRLK